ncbi:hypothetical protein [Brucella sp. JSBI001]|uniref:hypothetical protein n=1 Tax=Brucella sp. JSBI001 TaxID=2886044 RepID=UPI002230E6CF|nr:hypothetical protein [Brucella sp. JSBI001]UZD70897.1 hypothetical protein LJ361_05625 [Brucella sp. JSBI001]
MGTVDQLGKSTEQRIQDWLADDYYWYQRFGHRVRAWWNNSYRIRFWGSAHLASKTVMSSSAPAAAYYYGTVTLVQASIVSGSILLLSALVEFSNKRSKDKLSNAPEIHADMMLRVGDFFSLIKLRTTKNDNDDAIRSCLGILENYACLITNSPKGQISVSLVLYAGSSKTRMKIKHRNPGNTRPTNREFDATQLMGYRACSSGTKPRVVHDLKSFGKSAGDSPTQSGVNYRSFLLIPIQSPDGNRIRGFVSVDSPRPFAFYGERSSVLMVRCEPILNHLSDLIERT